MISLFEPRLLNNCFCWETVAYMLITKPKPARAMRAAVSRTELTVCKVVNFLFTLFIASEGWITSAEPDMTCFWDSHLHWLRHTPFPLPSPTCAFQTLHCSPKAQRQASSRPEVQDRPRSRGPVDPPPKLASEAQPGAMRSKMDENRDGWEEGQMS